jgi:type I restriction enzyme M protein
LQRHAIGASQDAQRVRYDELIKRDKLNLDIFRLKDASLDDPDSLPPPDEIAAVIKVSLR